MVEINLEKLSRLARYYSLVSTTAAQSGHLSSCLSSADLMVGLCFGGFFKYRVNQPGYNNNDRLIFSKGHAAPLFYSLWALSGVLTLKQLKKLRQFNSPLEGHPTMTFPYTEAATGSLGQGLSIGLGMALSAKYLTNLSYRTYVLLGDSEMSEGSVWEALQLASYYKLCNLVAIIDVNRLGQRGPTMYGYNLKAYQRRLTVLGWRNVVIDGHSWPEILKAYKLALKNTNRPFAIIARTVKGRGIKLIENKLGWHGRALKPAEFKKAVKDLGALDFKVRGQVSEPNQRVLPSLNKKPIAAPKYKLGDLVATREAYGSALVRIYPQWPQIAALDAEVSNSTNAQIFAKKYPKRFLEMFIAEQNMVGAAVGLARVGQIPFVSTFSAFFTRAFDQIRMSQYADADIKFVGSHAGVSIGADGPSQMGLEDLAMFRTLPEAKIFYPADAVSCERLVELAASTRGLVYIRTTRGKTKVLYQSTEKFILGGSKVVRQSNKDVGTIVSAGVTLYQALDAADQLKKKGVVVRVVDLYSIQPLDKKTLLKCAKQTKFILTVEDHRPAGGLGEAVAAALGPYKIKIVSLAVWKQPKSGTPQQLLDYENIGTKAILKAVTKLASK
ncbi:MAG: transketolase [Patescibacteria group bacterium]